MLSNADAREKLRLTNFALQEYRLAAIGWLGYLIAGFIGACILIFGWRAIKGRT